MNHRHLNHTLFSLAAIDDIIERGGREDWAALRDYAARDKALCRKVLKVCDAHAHDTYAQRYFLWRQYARQRVV